MSHAANKIYMAVVAHTAWKKRFHDIVTSGKGECDTNPERCEFGKWLIDNIDEFKVYAYYPKVLELHSQFHQEAHRIMALHLSGKKSEASGAVNYGSEFERISQELVRTVIAWHGEVSGKK